MPPETVPNTASLTAGSLAAIAAGMPSGLTIAAAIVGGLIAVWMEHSDEISISLRWVGGAALRVIVSAAAGIALAAIALAIAAHPESVLAPIAGAPEWALAGVIAASVRKFAPLAWSAATAWLQRKTTRAAAEE
ncbi:hypothetical protein [Rubrivivax gelatinosus]|uniref:Uncharacterized protein n=1 Tax=Rubrivivax gelatinosus TaxID=28068 RepID=A0A4R2MKV2_RUBGE|nr:hypothetical protein [Rubrivivax gelatinosus]MBK1686192.1 hypothetical protein [Rubrivivax gelatinosus]TCP05687.1 hypothetical protein EV684_101561 [Rubrivivax gelatinosus]